MNRGDGWMKEMGGWKGWVDGRDGWMIRVDE